MNHLGRLAAGLAEQRLDVDFLLGDQMAAGLRIGGHLGRSARPKAVEFEDRGIDPIAVVHRTGHLGEGHDRVPLALLNQRLPLLLGPDLLVERPRHPASRRLERGHRDPDDVHAEPEGIEPILDLSFENLAPSVRPSVRR